MSYNIGFIATRLTRTVGLLSKDDAATISNYNDRNYKDANNKPALLLMIEVINRAMSKLQSDIVAPEITSYDYDNKIKLLYLYTEALPEIIKQVYYINRN